VAIYFSCLAYVTEKICRSGIIAPPYG
jgi:hypothetical protein